MFHALLFSLPETGEEFVAGAVVEIDLFDFGGQFASFGLRDHCVDVKLVSILSRFVLYIIIIEENSKNW